MSISTVHRNYNSSWKRRVLQFSYKSTDPGRIYNRNIQGQLPKVMLLRIKHFVQADIFRNIYPFLRLFRTTKKMFYSSLHQISRPTFLLRTCRQKRCSLFILTPSLRSSSVSQIFCGNFSVDGFLKKKIQFHREKKETGQLSKENITQIYGVPNTLQNVEHFDGTRMVLCMMLIRALFSLVGLVPVVWLRLSRKEGRK